MDKIRLGKTEMMVTRVGFGSIPIQRDSDDEADEVIRRCLDKGINFIDSATGYTTSEERIGKTVAGRSGELFLSTKAWLGDVAIGKERIEKSLAKFGRSIDIYQIHQLSNAEAFKKFMEPNGLHSVIQKYKEKGLIKHIGVTCHNMDTAKEAVKSGVFETMMFPFNLLTPETAEELLPLARKYDVGFIAMKPMAGGMLEDPTIAMKYLLQFPDVLILVGIEHPDQVDEIVKLAESKPKMTAADRAEVERLRKEIGTTFCHRCDYCQPCTAGIAISAVMHMRSTMKRFPPSSIISGPIGALLEKSAECTQCRKCEDKCPYHLPISEMMQENAAYYQQFKADYLKSAGK